MPTSVGARYSTIPWKDKRCDSPHLKCHVVPADSTREAQQEGASLGGPTDGLNNLSRVARAKRIST